MTLHSHGRKTVEDSFLGSTLQPSSNIFLSRLFHAPSPSARSKEKKSNSYCRVHCLLYESYCWPECVRFQLFKKRYEPCFFWSVALGNTGPYRKSGKPVSIQSICQCNTWIPLNVQKDGSWGRLSQILCLASSRRKRLCYKIYVLKDKSVKLQNLGFSDNVIFLPHIFR